MLHATGLGIARTMLMGLCAMAFAWGATAQQTAVIPSAAAATAGASGNTIPLGNFSSGVYQVMYNAAQMTGVPAGSAIIGIQLRLRNNASANFPTGAMTIPKFNLTLAGSALTPTTMTSTYATNMVNPVMVRSGPLNLAAGAYPGGAASGSTPEGWGPLIGFTTPFIYRGGSFVMEFRTENGATGTGSADHFLASGMSYMTSAPSTEATSPGVNGSIGLVARLTFIAPTVPFQTGVTRLLIQDELANIRGGSANAFPLGTGARTIQLIADAGEMRRLGLGSRLVGLHYRNASAVWPTGDQSFTKYDIQLSRALNTPATMSDTIATNTGFDATLVRSGPLNIASGSFAGLGASPRPAPWSLEFPFTTAYTYYGGPLLTVVRHDGVTGSGGSTAGILSTDATYGTRVKARSSTTTSSVLTATTSATSYMAQLWSVDAGTIAPGANTTVRGPVQLLTLYSNSPVTSQFIVNASELTYLPVGSQITGMTFRGRSASAGPTQDRAFANYRITMSSAAQRAATASTSFAANDGADVVEVRNGALLLAKESFPGGVGVNPFGPTLRFDRAFIYQGGDVCVTIRHPGNGVQEQLIDANSNVSLTRTIFAAGESATTGSLSSAGPIVRFEYNPSVVAPAALDNTPATIGYSVLFSSPGNVLQSVYSEAELRGLRIGSVITGMSLRSVNFGALADWPAAETVVGQFDVTLSRSPVEPQSMSDTFASNIGPDAVVVRSGALTIPAAAFPFVAGSLTRPSENRWFIQFTEPYVYNGGPLSVTIRNNSGAGASLFYADVFTGPASKAAGRHAFGAAPNATTATSTTNKGALAIRLAFVPQSFCPWDLNNDGIVSDEDFPLFLSGYDTLDCAAGGMEQGCPSDFNYDRVVDDSDFTLFLGAYNALVCP